jgi:hypothetical protein
MGTSCFIPDVLIKQRKSFDVNIKAYKNMTVWQVFHIGVVLMGPNTVQIVGLDRKTTIYYP